jgi:hypothetical protein
MDFWTNPSVILAAVVIAALIVAFRLRQRPNLSLAMDAERERIAIEAAPKCCCGEVATDPAPVLNRGRGAWDWLRNLYGAPPRYTRKVDHDRPPVLCSAHAHVADAMLDAFIFGIRNEYSALNATIAARAAGFEQEHLLRQITESLTDKQKRSQRVPMGATPLRSVRTGTDGDSDS